MKKKKRARLSGFSLIEVMAAVGLFAIALLGTLALMGQTMAFGKFSSNQMVAQNEARRVIENIRKTVDMSGLSSVASNNFNESLTSLPAGTVAVTDMADNVLVNNADPLPVRVTVTWNEKGQTKNFIVDSKVTQR